MMRMHPFLRTLGEASLVRAFRRSDWRIGGAVVAAVVAITLAGGLRPLEGAAYDLATAVADGRQPGDGVVVVAVDDASLKQVGAWPWSRYTLGEINALIAQGQPRVVGYALPLETAQNAHAQATVRSLYEAGRDRLGREGRQLFERAIRAMGTDRVLAASFRRSGGVVLGARYSATAHAPAEWPALPPSLRGAGLATEAAASGWTPAWFRPHGSLYVDRVYPPVPQLARAASGIGLAHRSGAGSKTTQRRLPLALRHADTWLPSLPLLLYARAHGVDSSGIRVAADRGVEIGERRFETGPDLGVYPVHYAARDGRSPFRVVSAADVEARKVRPALFRDRVVLVGMTTPRLVEPVMTPAGKRMPVMALADETASLINGDLFRVPEWAVWARVGAFAFVALYLMFLLPRLRLGTALALTGLVAVVLLSGELVAMTAQSTWIPLMAPLAALAIGHGVLGGKRRVMTTIAGFQTELSDANRELGEALRREGRLDEAFRRLQRCAPDEETLEQWYALGLDYERRRRFAQAAQAFRLCREYDPRFRDAAERVQRNEKLQESVVLGPGGRSGGSTQTMLLDDSGVQKPVLGRYRLDRELGKGAMGTVYLGQDPKIGREVAIKTMPLDAEFEGQSLEEIKARFLREAETAGRLDHPHIVKVHDVGEEQDLAWIAMDYLPGRPMSDFAEPESLLPPAEVFEVLAQVAEALDSAHEHNVIHRDIKPDNILYDRERGKAVVTDFGVACLLDHRNTRSGTILGSPSYMSPEQLAGRELDGRSDTFSMGVTLYQLLTGVLPFIGDSMSNLMYRIANERHREIKRLRPDLPPCATTITNRALEKSPERRYVSGAQLAQALRRCARKSDEG